MILGSGGYLLYNGGFFKATKQVDVEEIKEKMPSNNMKFPAELSDVLNSFDSFDGCILKLPMRVKVGDKVHGVEFEFRKCNNYNRRKNPFSIGPAEIAGLKQYGVRTPSGDWVYYLVDSFPSRNEPTLKIYKYCYTPEHSRELKTIKIPLGKHGYHLFDLNPLLPDYEIVYQIYVHDYNNASDYTEYKELWETGFILDTLRQMPLWDNFTEDALIEASAAYLLEGEMNYRKVPQKILDWNLTVTCDRGNNTKWYLKVDPDGTGKLQCMYKGMLNLLFIDNTKELERWVSILSDPHKAPESLDKMFNHSEHEEWKKREIPVADVRFKRTGHNNPGDISFWIAHMKKHLEVQSSTGKYYFVDTACTGGKELAFFTEVFSFAEPVGSDLDLHRVEGYIKSKKSTQLVRKFETENGTEWVAVNSYPAKGRYYIYVGYTKDNSLICYFIRTNSSDELKELWKKGVILGGLRKTDYWTEDSYAENTLIELVYRTWGI